MLWETKKYLGASKVGGEVAIDQITKIMKFDYNAH